MTSTSAAALRRRIQRRARDPRRAQLRASAETLPKIDMELTQLRAFRTVAETQSFTRAAERLNISQTAVSVRVPASGSS